MREDTVDPYHDRRTGEERRSDGAISTLLKVLGSPVSIVVLLGSVVLATINVVQKANGSLPAETYYEHRTLDSVVTADSRATTTAQLTEIQAQIAQVRLDFSGERARTDSVIRLVRHLICRQTPQDCQ